MAIIAHIDHGKSTFCDAIISICENIEQSADGPSLDSHDIEKNRGVTIRNHYKQLLFRNTIINLIDTPGHYDFKQYVNVGLHISENIILLIDISKGIQAQTIKYLEKAKQFNRNITVVLNKVDLQLDEVYKNNIKHEIQKNWNIDNIYEISAKKQTNVEDLLINIIESGIKHEYKIQSEEPLIFVVLDASVMQYKYTTITLQMKSGMLRKSEHIILGDKPHRIFKIIDCKYMSEEVECCLPNLIYTVMIMGNLSKICQNLTGMLYEDHQFKPYIEPYPICLYSQIKPESIEKFELVLQQINRVVLTEQMVSLSTVQHPIYTKVIQCGFYGLFHKEVFFDKLTLSNIEFQAIKFNHEWLYSPTSLKFHIVDYKAIEHNYRKYLSNILTPFLHIRIQAPTSYYNHLVSKIQLIAKAISIKNNEFTSNDFIISLQISEMDFLSNDFISFVKNVSNGYADIIIDEKVFIPYDISILEVMINKQQVRELTQLTITDRINEETELIMQQLSENLSRQQYEMQIQICCNKKIIKSHIIKPFRKDVTAKCYGGDATRKSKLLKKQKEGKSKLLKHFDINKIKGDILK